MKIFSLALSIVLGGAALAACNSNSATHAGTSANTAISSKLPVVHEQLWEGSEIDANGYNCAAVALDLIVHGESVNGEWYYDSPISNGGLSAGGVLNVAVAGTETKTLLDVTASVNSSKQALIGRILYPLAGSGGPAVNHMLLSLPDGTSVDLKAYGPALGMSVFQSDSATVNSETSSC